MQALVVYESMFGNTEQVARAVTTGLSKHLEVELVEVSEAPAVITGVSRPDRCGWSHARFLDDPAENPGGRPPEGAAHRLGYPSATKAESFYVQDVDGPLLEGELDRAQAWGDRLGAEAEARAQGRATS